MCALCERKMKRMWKLPLNVRLSDSNFFGLFCCLIQDFEPYVMITSALMLVKRSETAIAVQLCRFLCRFTQLFIYQRKKNTFHYRNPGFSWAIPAVRSKVGVFWLLCCSLYWTACSLPSVYLYNLSNIIILSLNVRLSDRTWKNLYIRKFAIFLTTKADHLWPWIL